MKSLTENKDVQALVEAFDLDYPKYYLEMGDYGVDDYGNLVIETVKVFDNMGNFIKLADIKQLVNHIHSYPVTFKNGC
jgi:hypothetical protein